MIGIGGPGRLQTWAGTAPGQDRPSRHGFFFGEDRFHRFTGSNGRIEASHHEMKSEDGMREILPSDLLRELTAVEGRYIQWEWEPQTLTNDYITLREATGYPVVQHDKSGRELSLRVSRGSVQRLISEHSVYEDEMKRGSGLRIFRPAEGARPGLRKPS
jgi:hypothetical protein